MQGVEGLRVLGFGVEGLLWFRALGCGVDWFYSVRAQGLRFQGSGFWVFQR